MDTSISTYSAVNQNWAISDSQAATSPGQTSTGWPRARLNAQTNIPRSPAGTASADLFDLRYIQSEIPDTQVLLDVDTLHRFIPQFFNLLQMDVQLALQESIQRMEQIVVQKYTPIAEVLRIYSLEQQPVHVFKVYFESAHYDPALMDRLLDAEIEVIGQYPGHYFDFNYIPVADRTRFTLTLPDYARQLLIR